jgi:hypothetical protein
MPSDVLTAIEGRRGEELTSAVLGLIVESSDSAGMALTKLLLDRAEVDADPQPIDNAECERSTKDEVEGRGRLDILLETEKRIFGIENKIWAAFQSGQPEKYWPSLEERARNANKTPHLYLLLPRWRMNPVKSDLYTEVKWQDVLQALEDGIRGEKHNDDATILIRWLNMYMEKQVEVLKPLAKYDDLQGKFERGGTESQRKTVDGIWYMFREIGVYGRANRGNHWSGYAFMEKLSQAGEHAWFGFIDGNLLVDGASDHSCFVVATTFECPGTENLPMKKITLGDPWWDRRSIVWRIDLGQVHDDEATWQQIARLFADAYAMRSADTGSAPVADEPV